MSKILQQLVIGELQQMSKVRVDKQDRYQQYLDKTFNKTASLMAHACRLNFLRTLLIFSFCNCYKTFFSCNSHAMLCKLNFCNVIKIWHRKIQQYIKKTTSIFETAKISTLHLTEYNEWPCMHDICSVANPDNFTPTQLRYREWALWTVCP